MASFLLYGSYGYTGSLIAQEAVRRGLKPILAGRDAAKLKLQAEMLGLSYRAFDLTKPSEIDSAIEDTAMVLHCAGPFWRTSKPMADACLRTGTHYLDITGEIAVFEALARRDREAQAASVMLLPGVGFDVVPSDCLASYLKAQLPSATHLILAFQGLGGLSRGTATTMIEGAGSGGMVRRDGKLTPVPAAYKTREIDFGYGSLATVTIPWGDISTAFYSTGIPNIEVYVAVSSVMRRALLVSRYLSWLLRTKTAQKLLKNRIRTLPPGPTEDQRAKGKSFLWGEVSNEKGVRAQARLETPEGYTLTVLTALLITEKVLSGEVRAGFQTPSLAYGADLILSIPGVSRLG